MAHIFISYSSQNADYTYKLVARLKDNGFDVWIDNANLRSSDNWWLEIVGALRVAKVFIVLMTPQSKQSRWVQREILLADEWKIPAFPLLLDGENFEIYVDTHFFDVRNGRLPAQSFYTDLEQYIKPHQTSGKDLTQEPINLSDEDKTVVKEELKKPAPPVEKNSIHYRHFDLIMKFLRRKEVIIILASFLIILLIAFLTPTDPVTLQFQEHPATTCTLTNVMNCAELRSITINGQTLNDSNSIVVDADDPLIIQSVEFSISAENLEIVDNKHGGSGFAFVNVFLATRPELVQRSTASEDLVISDGSKNLLEAFNTFLEPQWEDLGNSRFFTVQILHENHNGNPEEEVIAHYIIEVEERL